MTDKLDDVKKIARTRASARAFQIALDGMIAASLQIKKVCVNGGQIEIYCGTPENDEDEVGPDGLTREERAQGLKSW